MKISNYNAITIFNDYIITDQITNPSFKKFYVSLPREVGKHL